MQRDRYSDYTRNTNEFLKRVAHGRRHQQAVALLGARPGDVILDYGCGDAFTLQIIENVSYSDMVAYDPDPDMIAQIDSEFAKKINVYGDSETLCQKNPKRFSLILCFEVCEHLSPISLDKVFADFKRLIKPGGRILIGVPMETGVSGLLKNLYRLYKGRRMGATLSKAFLALFGHPIERDIEESGWISSHIGFREIDLLSALERAGFDVKIVGRLPFSWSGSFLNNESYWCCKVR